jgi:hypothetical protein
MRGEERMQERDLGFFYIFAARIKGKRPLSKIRFTASKHYKLKTPEIKTII